MPTRTYLKRYTRAVSLSESAIRNLAIVQENYAYTGVMEIATGIISLCGAAGTNPHYSTITPLKTNTFPQYVGGTNVAPIVHGGTGSGNTSHQILAQCVIKDTRRLASDEADFCGFTVRFNPKPIAEFSGTSRSLNTGIGFSNGELEECLSELIIKSLRPILGLYGWTTFDPKPPRTSPAAAQVARGGMPIPRGLLASLASIKKIQ